MAKWLKTFTLFGDRNEVKATALRPEGVETPPAEFETAPAAATMQAQANPADSMRTEFATMMARMDAFLTAQAAPAAAQATPAKPAEIAAPVLAALKLSAETYATGLIRNRAIMPAEKDATIESYMMAAQDDIKSPRTEGKTRVDTLIAQLAARPTINIEGESATMIPEDAQLLGTNSEGKEKRKETDLTPPGEPMSAERIAFLLNRTDQGQTVLERLKEQAKNKGR